MRPVCTVARRHADARSLPRWLGDRKMGRGEAPLLLEHPRPAEPTAGRDTLSVLTFNILHGGLRAEPLADWFSVRAQEKRLPDVLALQETNLPVSVRLSRKYGYHLAYYGRDRQEGLRFINGKALLSRHRIAQAMHAIYAVDEAARQAALHRSDIVFEGGPGELDEDRGALRISLRFDSQVVDLYTLHHTLGDAGINASQLEQLRAMVLERKAPAILAGDFNANLNLVRTHGIGGPMSATRSVEAYRARYGHLPTGRPDNAHDERVRTALAALRRVAADTFERGPTTVRRADGPALSPTQARRILNGSDCPADEPVRWRLQDIADGATLALDTLVGPSLPASGKRYDGILASAPWRPLSVELDRSGVASDHTPVEAILTRR